MKDHLLLFAFAASVAIVGATWIAYPALMWFAARLRRQRALPLNRHPKVSVVVATRDDPLKVEARVSNLLEATYPRADLEVIVSVDANSAFPIEAYEIVLDGRARVISGDLPGGKAATLNSGVRNAAEAEVLVFADIGQTFSSQTIENLVCAFQDEGIGGVGGRYASRPGEPLMAAFARLEAAIRAGQSALHSIVSTSGSICAVRRMLWRPLPDGLICDDLFTTMSVVSQGFRVAFCATAVASDQRSFTPDQQFNRRVRTLTGLIQFLLLEPRALLPWRNPIWVHLIMHKVLRLLTPVFLATAAVMAAGLAVRHAPRVLLTGAILSVVGLLVLRAFAPGKWEQHRRTARWLLRLQLVPAVAIANGVRRRWTVWTPDEPAQRGFVVPEEDAA